ncbi:MAG: threonine synthase [Saprospiraceae bacterium]|nr:threonine synthase [Saprospiraceae bacterium]MBL0098711.1 threonine synthase [Saprospiraceae bacterium]
MTSFYSHLECDQCHHRFDKAYIHSYCPQCTQPLVAKYHLHKGISKSVILHDRYDMWRYKYLLPVERDENIVTLGEGWTPLLKLSKTARALGLTTVFIKEEGLNPTGSFKARGIGMAVSKARELGLSSFCIPTAGNAGSALAAYTAVIGGEAHIYMPEATPRVFQLDCEVMGAHVKRIKGSIRDAGLAMAADNAEGQWWDITTLKEPFRLEGKKTMGYEIAEQLGWKLPDVIIYPTGGGTGLIGIWKAFNEMKEMGWVTEVPTRMVAVQTVGCNPVVRAFQSGQDHCELYQNPDETMANGLRVPKAFGDRLIMKTLNESNGYALDVTESEMMSAIHEFGRQEGIFLSPEGAAVYHGMKKLIDLQYIKPTDTVVIINTGSPYKYVDNMH